MKKLLLIALVLFVAGCSQEDIIEPTPIVVDRLDMVESSGIRLDNNMVTDEILINAKLTTSGECRVKIRDIANVVVSQEKLNVVSGDNILHIYTSALESSSYTIELVDSNNNIIGRDLFTVIKE